MTLFKRILLASAIAAALTHAAFADEAAHLKLAEEYTASDAVISAILGHHEGLVAVTWFLRIANTPGLVEGRDDPSESEQAEMDRVVSSEFSGALVETHRLVAQQTANVFGEDELEALQDFVDSEHGAAVWRALFSVFLGAEFDEEFFESFSDEERKALKYSAKAEHFSSVWERLDEYGLALETAIDANEQEMHDRILAQMEEILKED